MIIFLLDVISFTTNILVVWKMIYYQFRLDVLKNNTSLYFS